MGDISIKGHSPILRQGFAKGGRAGFKHGTKPDWKKGKFGKKTIAAMKKHDFPAGGPHQSLEGKKAALRHASIRAHEHKHGRDSKAEGGRIGFKKGGSDKNWIQKATASIKKRGTKGKCTPITKKGCTGRAKALAKTFKKMAKKRKGKAEGGRIGFQEGKRVDVPSSSQWKKPADKNLKPGQAKDAMEQYKNQPKKLKFRCG